MTIVHMSRASTPDELAAEMDRRGVVIERLEAEIERLTSALSAARREEPEAIARWHDKSREWCTAELLSCSPGHQEDIRQQRRFHEAAASAIRSLPDGGGKP